MAIRPHHVETGESSSAAGDRTAARRDPYYSPNLQATRLATFQGRKLAYVHYVDSNFPYKDGVYMTLVQEKGLSSSGSPLGDSKNKQCESFDVVEMYKSCLRGRYYFVPGDQ
ncbi:hypothetical protein Lal_00022800 [Lupinus albus]|nr:hypothetical protein Lal_00022800 [Lupinus albus]